MRRITTVLLLVFGLIASSVPALAGEIAADGVVHGGIYSDLHWSQPDIEGINAAAGKKVSLAGTFHDIDENATMYYDGSYSNTVTILDETWGAEATPFANVKIDDTAAAIAAEPGAYDTAIDGWASHVQAWLAQGEGRSVIIAPLQEMNGDWPPYGCDPDNFKIAYKKFLDTFRDRGMDETQVRFAYAPNGWTTPGCGQLADYYPDASIVDFIGISAYNFGTCVEGSTVWGGAYFTFNDPLTELRTFAAAKPYVIAQTGVGAAGCGGDQNAWVVEIFDYLAADDNVVGLVYFNFDKSSQDETDWRVWNGTTLTTGWTTAMQRSTTVYQWPLTEWFAPGAITVAVPEAPPGPCAPIDDHKCATVALIDAGGQWHRRAGLGDAATVDSFFFGNPGDVAFMGDWDCDGVATPGLYRQSDGFVYLRNTNTVGIADITFFLGNPGDYPLIGDWNGDGCDTVSIWRDGEARVFIVNELGTDGGGLGAAYFDYYFGNPGDAPFVGDFDGDGIDTIGLHRVSTGFAYFRNTLMTGSADLNFFYGDPGDIILAGDWDGDGDDTVAVYRPSTGNVYFNMNNGSGAADYTLFVGSYDRAVAGP